MNNNYDYNLKDVLIDNIKQGNEGIIPIKGISMEPTLYEGDVLVVKTFSSYSVGDIIVFKYFSEGILVHRIIDIEGSVFFCKGDNAKRIEIIMKRQIIGKVIKVYCGGKNEK